jgi:thiol-disulfide isomerase/thioredoxin
MTMKRFIQVIVVAVMHGLIVCANTAVSAPETSKLLCAGDLAPGLRMGEWVQGEPVRELEKGKAYLIDFWATWCKGCVDTIPHLNAIHRKYKEKGLVVIGQCVSKKDRAKVAPFVKKMDDRMTYRVALDDFSVSERGAMSVSWFDAAGQTGIPVAFLVGKDGRIAWIGSPLGLVLEESIIEGVLDGTFDGVKVRAGPMGQRKFLKPGDPAPPLRVGKWIQGEPVKEFERGKAYLLDFWASWCGGCSEAIPRLNEIQRKYGDKGLVVIGQNVYEAVARSPQNSATALSQAVGKMNFRVAIDDVAGSKTGLGAMLETWMVLSGMETIPASFLVGRDGRIAWMGNPVSLDDALIEAALGARAVQP